MFKAILSKSRQCKGRTRYNSAYLAYQEAQNHFGYWSFAKCEDCNGWHINKAA